MECARCRGYAGWVCEQHPGRPFCHERADGTHCPGPGVPCPAPGCEHSLLGPRPYEATPPCPSSSKAPAPNSPPASAG